MSPPYGQHLAPREPFPSAGGGCRRPFCSSPCEQGALSSVCLWGLVGDPTQNIPFSPQSTCPGTPWASRKMGDEPVPGSWGCPARASRSPQFFHPGGPWGSGFLPRGRDGDRQTCWQGGTSGKERGAPGVGPKGQGGCAYTCVHVHESACACMFACTFAAPSWARNTPHTSDFCNSALGTLPRATSEPRASSWVCRHLSCRPRVPGTEISQYSQCPQYAVSSQLQPSSCRCTEPFLPSPGGASRGCTPLPRGAVPRGGEGCVGPPRGGRGLLPVPPRRPALRRALPAGAPGLRWCTAAAAVAAHPRAGGSRRDPGGPGKTGGENRGRAGGGGRESGTAPAPRVRAPPRPPAAAEPPPARGSPSGGPSTPPATLHRPGGAR